MNTKTSTDTKRKIYHGAVLATALAIPITINILGFVLGWWERLASSPG